jgi:hypothetical protein
MGPQRRTRRLGPKRRRDLERFQRRASSRGKLGSDQLRDMDGDGIPDLAGLRKRPGRNLDRKRRWELGARSHVLDPHAWLLRRFRVGGDADHNGLPTIAIVDEEGGPFSSRNHLHFYRERSVPLALKARLVQPGPHATLRTARSVSSSGPARFRSVRLQGE